MKKIVLIIVSIVFVAISCDKDDDRYPYYPGSGLKFETQGLTYFDSEVKFDFSVSNLECKVVALSTEEYSSEVSLDDEGMGSKTISASDLKLSAINDAAILKMMPKIKGNPLFQTRVVMRNPIVVEDLKLKTEDIVRYLKWNVEAVDATVDDQVKVFEKVGVNNDYNEIMTQTFNAKDSLALNGINYNENDTLFIKLKATSGELEADYIAKMIVRKPAE